MGRGARYNAAMNSRAMLDPLEALRLQLNGETGRIDWPGLQRHFARGVLIKVAADLDLVEVAARFAADDRDAVAKWLACGRVARASTEDATEWQARPPRFWAVVTAPWVLVQEVRADDF